MLSGSALLRVSVLLVVAGGLAALVQLFRPRTAAEPAPEPPAAAAPAARPATRRSEPAPAPQPAPPAPAMPQAETPAAPASPAPVPAMPAPAMPSPPPVALPPAEPVRDQPGQASDNAGPRAVGLVDLNTASAADLNRLRGGGAIGRAIVQKRPYTAVDQLLSKRVLSRATYERIKDQVSVQ